MKDITKDAGDIPGEEMHGTKRKASFPLNPLTFLATPMCSFCNPEAH
jgi:hypothetical protein